MLQQAHLAHKVSEDAFYALDQEFSQYQKEHPRSTSYTLPLSSNTDENETKSIALHFSDAGYDVTSKSYTKLVIDWAHAEEGRIGLIDINNARLTFVRKATKR